MTIDKIKEILVFLPLVALLISLIFNFLKFGHNQNANKQYKEKIIPELECSYKYYASQNKRKFAIKNIGLVDSKNIWAQETMYALIDERVYEGTEVPHYNYILWNGSRERMWDIEKDAEIEIDLPKLQIKSFFRLKDKYDAILVNKWILTYSSATSTKKYRLEKYFVFDFEEQNFKDADEIVGGKKMLDFVRDYIAYGVKETINIFQLSGDFELNTPNSFLVNPDYSIKPLYPSTVCTIEDFNNSLLFISSFDQIQHSDDLKGTVAYEWKFDNGRWKKSFFLGPGAQLYSTPVKLPLAYLSQKESKLVKENPRLLKYYRKDRPPPAENSDEILEKAREKYFE